MRVEAIPRYLVPSARQRSWLLRYLAQEEKRHRLMWERLERIPCQSLSAAAHRGRAMAYRIVLDEEKSQ